MSTSIPIPPVDRRITEWGHLDLPYVFTPPRTKAAWQSRAKALREHILVSLGLWPAPDKSALNPKIFDRITHKDYTVEKVYFESLPGFFVTGNLYRPRGKKAPFPGILNPHGHWKEGRLADGKEGSVPGRCIHFARQGYVAFSYDMIGYNDSTQISHQFGGERELLWGISLMGLQLWNSIRAVDFLALLDEVDAKRIGCTGASGGGTQTFMLTAVDDRIAVSAPVNMISAHMQGDCLCENGPNIRIDTNNIEIGAMMAPRPMLLVSASGDWTVNTPDIEYPAIREVYKLFGAENRLGHVQIDAGHNYNKESREAVYAWFGKWLLHSKSNPSSEQPYTVEAPDDLLVFASEPRPAHAVDEKQLVEHLIAQTGKQLEKLRPTDAKTFRKFRQTMSVAFRSVIGATVPDREDLIGVPLGWKRGKGYTAQNILIGRKGVGDRIPGVVYAPLKNPKRATLVVHPAGNAGLVDAGTGALKPLLRGLLAQGHAVLTIDAFLTGVSKQAHTAVDIHHATTYNRTTAAHRVQDVITAVAYLREHTGQSAVSMIGFGEAGLWGLLACGLDPHILRAALSANAFDDQDDRAYLDHLFIPCLRRIGGFWTAATLAAPAALFIHNTGDAFRTDWIEDIYRTANAHDRLKISKRLAPTHQLVKWVVEGPAEV